MGRMGRETFQPAAAPSVKFRRIGRRWTARTAALLYSPAHGPRMAQYLARGTTLRSWPRTQGRTMTQGRNDAMLEDGE